MVVAMSEKATTVELPTTGQPTEDSNAPIQMIALRRLNDIVSKSRANRKYVIAGMTCAVVVALVIAGSLVGIKLFLSTTSDLVKRTVEYKLADGKTFSEHITSDSIENLVAYHLTGTDNEIWVINDFNRDLQTIKTKTSHGVACYVTPLSRAGAATPDVLKNMTFKSDEVETSSTAYNVSSTAIKEKSWMSAQGQQLCANIDVYWMTPACTDESSAVASGQRHRRAATVYCYILACYKFCEPSCDDGHCAKKCVDICFIRCLAV